MAKILGYILAILGIALIALGSSIEKLLGITLPEIIKPLYITIAGGVIAAIGILVLLGKSSSKTKQSGEEVPIYQGEGKKRKIVGYRKS